MKSIFIVTGVFYPEIGRLASYAGALGERLAKENSVTILTYSDKSKYIEDKDYPFRIYRVSRKLPKFIRHAMYYLRCRQLASKSDIVFGLNARSAGWAASKAAKSYKKKFYVKITSDAAWEWAVNHRQTALLINDFQQNPKTGHVKTLHEIQKRVCENSTSIIVPSKYLRNMLQNWGINPEKIKIIYNGVDFKPSGLSREDARKELRVMGNILISVGGLVPWKGFRMLIKLMPRILEINNFFKLVIVGDGPERDSLRQMIRNLKLENKVFVVGQKSQKELATYLEAADIFILNTGYEGFSHQVLEAMSSRVPVITTAVGSNLEVIKQGENGFLVKYNDEFNLIEAIKTLWQNKEMCEQFIEEGRKTVEKFSFEKMFDETIKLISS